MKPREKGGSDLLNLEKTMRPACTTQQGESQKKLSDKILTRSKVERTPTATEGAADRKTMKPIGRDGKRQRLKKGQL